MLERQEVEGIFETDICSGFPAQKNERISLFAVFCSAVFRKGNEFVQKPEDLDRLTMNGRLE